MLLKKFGEGLQDFRTFLLAQSLEQFLGKGLRLGRQGDGRSPLGSNPSGELALFQQLVGDLLLGLHFHLGETENCPTRETSIPSSLLADTGTRLTLGSFCKVWNDEDYDELHARLSRLISPFKDVTGFEIELSIPTRPELCGAVQPPDLILKPRYLLKGKVSAAGLFTGTLLIDGVKARSFKNHRLDAPDTVPVCGPFEVEIRGWDRDREGLASLVEELHQGVQEIRRTLDIYCGVSIYRDGFRVYPYGQKGNDWLNLDLRSRLNPVKSLANNQIVAAVRISREHNPGLKDRSTREGMILNAEHAALEDWFKMVLSLLEEERYRSRKRPEPRDSPPEPLFEPFDIKPAVQQARKALGNDHPIAVLFSDTEKQVKEGVERVQEVFSRLLMHAGLGHMVDIVIHEIGSPLGKVNRQIVLLEREVKKGLSDAAWVSVEPMFQSIKGWLEQIHALRQRLDPQTPAKRGRATTFTVKEEIEDAFELYRALLEKQGIQWKIRSPKTPIRVKMARSALGQVIVNLLDNSIYWITKDKGAGKGGQILVQLEPLASGFRVLLSDDGPGVEEEDQARIFEPYFTRKPNGIGLGLYIARLVIEPYGKLVYNSEGELAGACFEAVFERSVGK